MRKLTILAVASSLALQGCAAITADLRHPGGYPGRLLDKRAFDSSESKQVQLLRFTIIMAMAARMSGETVRTSEHADAVAKHLGATADEINRAAANIYAIEGAAKPGPCSVAEKVEPIREQKDAVAIASLRKDLKAQVAEAKVAAERAQTAQSGAEAAEAATRKAVSDRTFTIISTPIALPLRPAPTQDCGGYFVNFEADVPLIEYPLINLILGVLPRDQLKDFADDLEKGNLLGGAFGLLKVIFVGVKGLHTAAGTYRTGQEALIANLPTEKGCSRLATRRTFVEEADTVKQAVACLGLDANSLFGPHLYELKGDNLPMQISEHTFEALMFVARTSCVRLPIGSGDNTIQDVQRFREQRSLLCAKIIFKPERRRDVIDVKP